MADAHKTVQVKIFLRSGQVVETDVAGMPEIRRDTVTGKLESFDWTQPSDGERLAYVDLAEITAITVREDPTVAQGEPSGLARYGRGECQRRPNLVRIGPSVHGGAL